ncbi:Cation/hydrogen exchanger 15 [Heracleum sosnowskyi]|uniref:Cation/hydrogen exchanger 15 n=1 Tax=Heracleum sosnowskyi TaxID=360622 RepID=A0AAD8LVC6_9APIA|nr:Cation/hydrogen exchanger 15 [Heracleum sosnowskyi]
MGDLVDVTIEDVNRTIICYAETIYRTNGVWEGPNPLAPILPIFIFQLPVAIFATRISLLLLKPFNMPPFIGELIGGILLGPTFFGKIAPSTYKWFFPSYGFVVLEPMAHFALVYYAFLVGLTLDTQAIRRTGSKAMGMAITGAAIPCLIGCVLFFVILSDETNYYGCIFWGFALTVSSYSALGSILEDQSLIHTEVGKLAMSAAQVGEVISWGLLAIGLAVANSASHCLFAIILTIVFALFCFHAVRPALSWIIKKTGDGQGFSEFYICFILSGVAICGVITDAIGTHPMLGAFIFGLIMPNEVLQTTLVERLEDFVMGIFMPAFFAVCGIRTNLDSLSINNTSLAVVVGIIVILSGSKVISSLLSSFVTNMTAKEAATVGLLTSTKSILALIILEIAQEHGVLTTQEYTIMVVSVVVMTMLVPPIILHYHPNNDGIPYTRKTIEKTKSVEELRVLACVHKLNNVPSVINVLEAANATKQSPIRVYALQLIELIGRASAMLVVHNGHKASSKNPTKEEAQTDEIISAFDNYELRCDGVNVQALTSRCPYSTMDEDICSIAREKRAAFIILPFHRQQNADGEMEDINPTIRTVNENVLAHAPCSVGVLIDRQMAETRTFPNRVSVLFFGGPDDREALSYAWRMSEHQNVRLTVIRFAPGKDALQVDPTDFMTPETITVPINAENEQHLDDQFLNKFKLATAQEKSVVYQEIVLNDEEETVRAIKNMENNYDLFVVGRGRGMVSPLTAGLADWCDCPELGPIGDLFATSEFSSSFSVLVMQQYIRSDGSETGSESYAESSEAEHDMSWRPSNASNEGYEPFGHMSFNHRRDHSLGMMR